MELSELSAEALPEQSYDDLPETGAFAPPPQPGPYRFQLPGTFNMEEYNTPDGKRLRVIFDKDHALLIVNSPGGKLNGDTYQTRVSNQARARGKQKIMVSDMDYLLRALGVKSRPKDNPGFAELLLAAAGKQFSGDIAFSYKCAKDKEIRVLDEATGKTEKVEGSVGCGKAYYQRDVAKVEGLYPEQIQCECGAALRAFANLDGIRS